MTDRELLKDAAKAAGYEYGIIHDAPRIKCDAGWTPWNPLTDDGDAFRLMVKLKKMPVIERWSEGDDWVFIPGHEGGALPLGDDPLAATRRVIVRAAAEIGKGMK